MKKLSEKELLELEKEVNKILYDFGGRVYQHKNNDILVAVEFCFYMKYKDGDIVITEVFGKENGTDGIIYDDYNHMQDKLKLDQLNRIKQAIQNAVEEF